MLPTPDEYETHIIDTYTFVSHAGFKYTAPLVRGKDTLTETDAGYDIYHAEKGVKVFVSKPTFITELVTKELKTRVKKPGECVVAHCAKPAKETSRFCRDHEKE